MRELEKRPFLRKKDYRDIRFQMTDKEYRLCYRAGSKPEYKPVVEIYVKYPGRKNFCQFGGYYADGTNVEKSLKAFPSHMGWLRLWDIKLGLGDGWSD